MPEVHIPAELSAKPRRETAPEALHERPEWLVAVELGQRVRQLELRLQQMESSRSWALTRPLRHLMAVLHPAPKWSPPALLPAQVGETPPSPYRGPALPTAPMRPLYVDVTALAIGMAYGGVQRLSRRLLMQWLVCPPAGFVLEPVRLAQGGHYVHARQFLAAFTGRDAGSLGHDTPVRPAPNALFIGLDVVRDHSELYAQGLSSLRSAGVRVATVVCDLLPLTHPQWFPGDVPKRFAGWWQATLTSSDAICCISHATAEAVRTWAAQAGVGGVEPRLRVFPLGGDLSPFPRRAQPVPATHTSRLRLLTVGTVEPRKGHAEVLDVLEPLWASGSDIGWTLLGRMGWCERGLLARIDALVRRGAPIIWQQDADDLALAEAYASHDALLMASEGEGFGLPVAEAMHAGLPLILRDLPVFREAAGDDALYFGGPHSPPLKTVLARGNLKTALTRPAAAGRWADAAKALLDAAT